MPLTYTRAHAHSRTAGQGSEPDCDGRGGQGTRACCAVHLVGHVLAVLCI